MISKTRSIRRRISAFGAATLAVVAFGAIGASAAQAVEWGVDGHTLVEREASPEAVVGSGGSFQLNSTVLGKSLELSCSSAASSGTIASGGSGSSSLSLSGCTVPQPSGCTVKSPLVLEASVQLIEVGNVVYQQFTPKNGTTFATVALSNCASAGNYLLKGSLAGLGPQAEELVDQPISFSSAIDAAAGTALLLGKQAAALSGSVEQHLGGALTGRTWQAPQAANPFNWQIGVTELSPGQNEPIAISGGPFEFDITYSGSHLQFSCSGVSGKESRILYGAGSEGKLTFSGCAMSAPAGCSVSSSIQTNALYSSLRNLGGYDYETFAPAPGGSITNVKIEGCSVAGTYQLTGSFTGKGTQDGVMSTSQSLAFSPANDATAGTSIKAGSGPVTITGTMDRQLSGANAGKEWGVN